MEYALSTAGQGAISYVAIPNWTFNANANTSGSSFIEVDVRFDDWRGATFAYVLGASGSTQNALRITTATGVVTWRTSATDRIVSSPGLVLLGQRNKFRLEYNKATTTTALYVNDVLIGTFVASNSVSFNQIGRFSTSAGTYSDLTLFGVSVGGAVYAAYSDSWDGSTTTGTGTSWTSTSGTRSLTITNATGASDSWWIPQGATLVPVTSFSILETNFRAEVSSSVQATTSFRQSLEKLETLATTLRANVSRSILASASFRADVAGLYILETAFGASLSPVQRAAALQVVLRSQVSSSKTTEAALRNNVSKASQANAVFRANVSKASTVSTALRASLEAQTALQARLLGIASVYKVLSVNLEGITDWTAPAFRVSMSLETPRASLSFGNKAGISFSTPRAKI